MPGSTNLPVGLHVTSAAPKKLKLCADTKCPPAWGHCSVLGTSCTCRLPGSSKRPRPARVQIRLFRRRQHCQGACQTQWGPHHSMADTARPKLALLLLIMAKCEVACCTIQVWRYSQKSAEWQQDGATLVGHTDWVRDVAWAPSLGLPKSVIASAGQDGKVLIWTESRDVPGQWTPTLLHDFKVAAHSFLQASFLDASSLYTTDQL